MIDIKKIENFEDLNIRSTFRAYIAYEQITGHSHDLQKDGISGIMLLFYCNIIAVHRDTVIDYDDFLDWLDEHPDMLNKFVDWYIKVNSMVTPEKKEPVEESK